MSLWVTSTQGEVSQKLMTMTNGSPATAAEIPAETEVKIIDVAGDDGLGLDRRGHLNVLGLDAVFFVKAFFLGDIERHVGKGQRGKADADFIRSVGRGCDFRHEQTEHAQNREE